MQNTTQSLNDFMILVYGLPASGKSTFAHMLRLKFFPNTLCLFADRIEAFFLEHPQFNIRQVIDGDFNKLHELLKHLSQRQFRRAKFESENWKKSRVFIEQTVTKLGENRICVIIEDDLLYRSQRRVFKKICWKTKLSYLQILMNTPMDQCLQNLKNRNQRMRISQQNGNILEQSVVVKANQKLEYDEDNEYGLSLDMKQRQEVTKNEILEHLKIVMIIPNDPNDPNYKHQRPKYQHNQQELVQIETRRYIGYLMNKKYQQLLQELGADLQQFIDFHNKPKISKLLANWKKHYVNTIGKSIQHQVMKQSLRNYIQFQQKHH